LFVLFCWFACSPTGCVCKGYVQSVHWVAFGMLLLAKKEGLSTLPFPLWHVCVWSHFVLWLCHCPGMLEVALGIGRFIMVVDFY
jgi:hypothetical protein